MSFVPTYLVQALPINIACLCVIYLHSMYCLTHLDHYALVQVPRSSGFLINTYTCAYAATRGYPTSACVLSCLVFIFFREVSLFPSFLCHNGFFSRLYMDGWRDGLNRLWRDGVTILPRPAKKIATAKNNRPVPALEKKKNPAPSHPVEKKNNRPVAPRKKQKPAPSRFEKKKYAPLRHEQQNTPPRAWKLETNTTACLFFSLSCCTFISYCSLVRSIF